MLPQVMRAMGAGDGLSKARFCRRGKIGQDDVVGLAPVVVLCLSMLSTAWPRSESCGRMFALCGVESEARHCEGCARWLGRRLRACIDSLARGQAPEQMCCVKRVPRAVLPRRHRIPRSFIRGACCDSAARVLLLSTVSGDCALCSLARSSDTVRA